MKSLSFLIFSGTAAIAFAEPILFTPNFETRLVDGIAMKRMFFYCGSTEIYFRPSSSWEVTGWRDNVVFHDKRLRDATIKFENAPAGMPKAFDASGLEEYRKVASGLMPAEASNVKALSENRDAVEINQWKGYEAFFSYDVSGKKWMRSILFIKLDPEREIRVIADAHPEDFEALHEALVRSLATWCEAGR